MELLSSALRFLFQIIERFGRKKSLTESERLFPDPERTKIRKLSDRNHVMT